MLSLRSAKAIHHQEGREAVKIPATEYWVCENFPNDKAVGHEKECSYFKVHGGDAPKNRNVARPIRQSVCDRDGWQGDGQTFPLVPALHPWSGTRSNMGVTTALMVGLSRSILAIAASTNSIGFPFTSAVVKAGLTIAARLI
jgi:hypothetical protein